jgi:hypothetical protein
MRGLLEFGGSEWPNEPADSAVRKVPEPKNRVQSADLAKLSLQFFIELEGGNCRAAVWVQV